MKQLLPTCWICLGAQTNPDRGSFFAGLSGYATNYHFQKAALCGTLIVARNMAVRGLAEAIYLLILFSINAENRVIIHERITICSQKHDPDILHLSVHRHRLWRIDE